MQDIELHKLPYKFMYDDVLNYKQANYIKAEQIESLIRTLNIEVLEFCYRRKEKFFNADFEFKLNSIKPKAFEIIILDCASRRKTLAYFLQIITKISANLNIEMVNHFEKDGYTLDEKNGEIVRKIFNTNAALPETK